MELVSRIIPACGGKGPSYEHTSVWAYGWMAEPWKIKSLTETYVSTPE